MILVSACWLASPVVAQTARATGTVHDTEGKPIKGATIRAQNPEVYPPQVISTTDTKGRWAMLGLRSGTYTFIVEAPGFYPAQGSSQVRTAPTPPLVFTLARDPGPIPGALPANIQAQVAAANMLRDQGRVDQAISAYQEIRNKNPNLTLINLVMGTTYRRKASLEANAGQRRAALERAIECYTEALKTDPANDQVKADIESIRAEVSRITN